MIARMIPLLLTAMLLVTGCGPAPAADELVGAGSPSPQAAVESFLEDLNQALADPQLSVPDTRRSWAERLASHFAPSERADQRTALAAMLADFAVSRASPAVGSGATLEIDWTRIDLLEQEDERALVRVVDGVMILRFFDDEGELLRERTGGLAELIGQPRGGLPALRVGGRWFLTEG